jgi:uncharacterized protein
MIASPRINIDPRSYHVFEFRGDRLLFDRATGATFELNDVTFEYFRQAKEVGAEAALDALQAHAADEDLSPLFEWVERLQQRGMFRFTSVDHSEQDEMLEGLWNHQPRRIQMLMAQGCNLGCRYCYAWRNGSNQKHTLMPWKVARQAVDYLVWRSGPRPELQITFFGGEPLLNYPVIQQVVRYCRDVEKLGRKKFVFELITNGTLLDKEVTDFIVREQFLLFVSIDGWREMHNYNRPSIEKDDLYDTIVANAQYANAQYKKHGLQAPKVRANLTNKFHDGMAVGKYLESLGFTTIGVGPIEPLPHGDPSPSALSEDQCDELTRQNDDAMAECLEKLKRRERLGAYLGSQFNKQIAAPQARKLVGVTCGIGRNTVVVDNKGNMFPCHRYEGMDAYVIGNVFTGLDRQSTMGYYRKVNGHATENCHDCWIRDFCGGGCVWLLSAKDGHIADPTDRECDRRRHGIERSLWLRTQMRKHFPDRFARGDEEASLDQWSWEAAVGPKRRGTLSLKVLPSLPAQQTGCSC